MPFPNQIGSVMAPAVAGDFASSNPRATALGDPGQYVAGPNGVVVGRFCWIHPDYDGRVENYAIGGSTVPTGFVHGEGQAMITTWLAESSMLIPPGMPVIISTDGDFWVKNDGSTSAQRGQKCYANLADGKATFAATGSATAGSITASIAPATGLSCTGSITDNVLTVTALAAGNVYPGTILTGTGVATGTTVIEQISGTANGVGTYRVNMNEQTVASTTISGTVGIMTVTAADAGELPIGAIISGGTVTAGTTLYGYGTGTGTTGTYYVSPSQTQVSATLATTENVETKWYAASFALAGELVKITTRAPGA